MARAYLKWSASKLADKSGVALSTIKRIENEDGISNTRVNNIMAVRDALASTRKVRFEGSHCVCVTDT